VRNVLPSTRTFQLEPARADRAITGNLRQQSSTPITHCLANVADVMNITYLMQSVEDGELSEEVTKSKQRKRVSSYGLFSDIVND